jgi:hypothetical protein
MRLYEALRSIEQISEELIDTCKEATHESLGLDPRAGYDLMVASDFIACPKNAARSLNYYGGFEYVDTENVITMGEWVIYYGDDELVRRHLDRVQNLTETSEKE